MASNGAIKIAYAPKYQSLSGAPTGASQLAGYEVLGRVIREGWSVYRIEALAAEYWNTTTTAIQQHEHNDLPVDFTKPTQHKIKKGGIKVLEVILDN